jgi:type VI secretion system protein ImpI
MPLTLTIENETSLPNGAPVSVTITDKRNLDIGRGAHLDWPLPDPSRFISGKHCEIRYRDGAYWLYDVSTNGTYLNDNTRRLQTPHRLDDGDRLAIGSYIIAVKLDEDSEDAASGASNSTELSVPIEDDLRWVEEKPTQTSLIEANPIEAAPFDASHIEAGAGSLLKVHKPESETPPEEAEAAHHDPVRHKVATESLLKLLFETRAKSNEAVPYEEDWNGDFSTREAEQDWALPALPPPYIGDPSFTDQIDPDGLPAISKIEALAPAQAAASLLKEPAPGASSDADRPASELPKVLELPKVSEFPFQLQPVQAATAGFGASKPFPDLFHDALEDNPAFEETERLGKPQLEPAVDFRQALPDDLRGAPNETASAPQDLIASPIAEDAAITLDAFIERFAATAGIPMQLFDHQDRLKTAEDLGTMMLLVVSNLKQLLSARDSAKRFSRSANRTVVQAFDNNPLKFAPTAEDALKIMFGPKTSGYLDGRRTLESAFEDLKTHQVKTFSAMQNAVKMLVEDLDPARLDTALGEDQGLLAKLSPRKSRLWDLYLARWQAKALRHDDGLADAFMFYFAECYDRDA